MSYRHFTVAAVACSKLLLEVEQLEVEELEVEELEVEELEVEELGVESKTFPAFVIPSPFS